MEPTTAAMIAKAAITVGTNKKFWIGIASVIAGMCIPFILATVCILNLASAAADHNRAAVKLAFEGSFAPISMPTDSRKHVYKMQWQREMYRTDIWSRRCFTLCISARTGSGLKSRITEDLQNPL